VGFVTGFINSGVVGVKSCFGIKTGDFVGETETGDFVGETETGDFVGETETGDFVGETETGDFVGETETGDFVDGTLGEMTLLIKFRTICKDRKL